MTAASADIDDGPAPEMPPLAQFEAGYQEFCEGRYFEAHDTWEDFWHGLRGQDRRFVQALIHLAVGAYHFENENYAGAESQWGKAKEKLSEYPPGHWGVNTSPWLTWIDRYIETKPAAAKLPQLTFDRSRFPNNLIIAKG